MRMDDTSIGGGALSQLACTAESGRSWLETTSTKEMLRNGPKASRLLDEANEEALGCNAAYPEPYPIVRDRTCSIPRRMTRFLLPPSHPKQVLSSHLLRALNEYPIPPFPQTSHDVWVVVP